MPYNNTLPCPTKPYRAGDARTGAHRSRADEMTGRLIEIYWDGDDTWFEAEVLSFDKATGLHAVVYLEVDEG